MANYRVWAKVLVEVETEFDEAGDNRPIASTVENCMSDDLNDGPWNVNHIEVVGFSCDEIKERS